MQKDHQEVASGNVPGYEKMIAKRDEKTVTTRSKRCSIQLHLIAIKTTINALTALIEQMGVNDRGDEMLSSPLDTLLPKLMSNDVDVFKIELPRQPDNHLPSSATIRQHSTDMQP